MREVNSKLSEQLNRAPPAGRLLRVLLGLALIIYVTPVYLQLPLRIFLGSLMLMFGLLVAYCVVHIVMSRRVVGLNLGTILVHGLVIAFYIAGFSRAPVFGGGKGQLAAVTFLGVSLVIAGIRGTAGCELMSTPNLVFQKECELTCLIFSPLDRLERSLRRKRDRYDT